MIEKLYFKVYQDIQSIAFRYYVDTQQGIINSLPVWAENHEEGEGLPVIEPVLMTDKEFNSLPEFEGY